MAAARYTSSAVFCSCYLSDALYSQAKHKFGCGVVGCENVAHTMAESDQSSASSSIFCKSCKGPQGETSQDHTTTSNNTQGRDVFV